MKDRLEAKHLVTIREAILDIYGEPHINAAFITGSIAAGKARANSDVDIFFCYDESIESPVTKKQEFVDFYFDLHEQLGREPDPISPGEVLSNTELTTAITDIRTVSPTRTLLNRDHFNAICWAGMLISKKEILVPPNTDISTLAKISRAVVQCWASELDPHTFVTFETGEPSDADKILRRTISSPGYYDAH